MHAKARLRTTAANEPKPVQSIQLYPKIFSFRSTMASGRPNFKQDPSFSHLNQRYITNFIDRIEIDISKIVVCHSAFVQFRCCIKVKMVISSINMFVFKPKWMQLVLHSSEYLYQNQRTVKKMTKGTLNIRRSGTGNKTKFIGISVPFLLSCQAT